MGLPGIAETQFARAGEDFEELCQQGCVPQILAAIVFLFRSRPRFEEFWEQIVGSPNQREKQRGCLKGRLRRWKGSLRT